MFKYLNRKYKMVPVIHINIKIGNLNENDPDRRLNTAFFCVTAESHHCYIHDTLSFNTLSNTPCSLTYRNEQRKTFNLMSTMTVPRTTSNILHYLLPKSNLLQSLFQFSIHVFFKASVYKSGGNFVKNVSLIFAVLAISLQKFHG